MNRPIDPLLPRAPAGGDLDEALIGELYRSQRGRLVGLAAAITLDRSVAEELVHDAFVGLQRRTVHIENPVGYLQRSVVNLSLSTIRRRKTADRYPIQPSSPPSSPEIDEAWSAVLRLPMKQRAVVAMRYWEDMTVADIAATLGWPEGSVKSSLHRALARLKEELS